MLLKKLQKFPLPAVAMNGSWEDWRDFGPDHDAKLGDHYAIRMGKNDVTWEKVFPELPESGSEFSLSGPFNDWSNTWMEPGIVPGQFVGHLTLNSSGEAEFQIIANESENMVYCPEHLRTTNKLAKICGPGSFSQERTWLISGYPRDGYRIEFLMRTDGKLSMTWMRDDTTVAEQLPDEKPFRPALDYGREGEE